MNTTNTGKVCLKPRLSTQSKCYCHDCVEYGVNMHPDLTQPIEVDDILASMMPEPIVDNVIYVDFNTRTIIRRGA